MARTVEAGKKLSRMRRGVAVDDILGRKVLARDGKQMGKLRRVYLDPVTLEVKGIDVDTGLFEKDSYLSREYIRRIGEHVVMKRVAVRA